MNSIHLDYHLMSHIFSIQPHPPSPRYLHLLIGSHTPPGIVSPLGNNVLHYTIEHVE